MTPEQEELNRQILEALKFTSVIVLILVITFTVAIYMTARYARATMITVIVGLVTVAAVLAPLMTASDTAATAYIGLAGVGLGAMAAAVRSVFGADQDQEPPTKPKSAPESESSPDSSPE